MPLAWPCGQVLGLATPLVRRRVEVAVDRSRVDVGRDELPSNSFREIGCGGQPLGHDRFGNGVAAVFSEARPSTWSRDVGRLPRHRYAVGQLTAEQ